MHLGEISFCDRQGFNIKSDEAKQTVLSSIESQYGIRIIQRHFDKFSDSTLCTLATSPHVVCIRTNGNPYLMYLTRHNFVNQVVFVDKKVQQGYFYPRMVIVRGWFDDALFDGTLIDGEMVRSKSGRWQYLCNDLIALEGSHLVLKPLSERLEMLRQLFSQRFMPDPDNDYCEFSVKQFYSYDQVEQLVTHIVPSLGYTCRGLLFKPMNLRHRDVLMNFDDTLVKKVVRVKYKDLSGSNFLTDESHLASVVAQQQQPAATSNDGISQESASAPGISAINMSNQGARVFYARKTAKPDVYELFERPECTGIAQIAGMPSMAASRLMRGLFTGANAAERVAVVCEWSERFEKWIPKDRLIT